jgi:hypothetical protein
LVYTRRFPFVVPPQIISSCAHQHMLMPSCLIYRAGRSLTSVDSPFACLTEVSFYLCIYFHNTHILLIVLTSLFLL